MEERTAKAGSRWLVHVGAGRSSCDVLDRASRLGFETLVFDRDGEAPGVRLASRWLPRSRDDPRGMLADLRDHARHHAVAGILTSSAAPDALLSAARLREALGLDGEPTSSVLRLLERSSWKPALEAAGVPTPRALPVASLAEVREFLERHPSALLKPDRGAGGSLGVAPVDPATPGLRARLEAARHASASGQALVEEAWPGREYSIDALVRRGETRLLMLSRKHWIPGPSGTLPAGYSWGAPEPGRRAGDDPRWRPFEALADRVARALGARDTLLSLDVLDGSRGPAVIDVGPLLDAKIDRALALCGIDVADIHVALATGRRPARSGPSPAALDRGHALRFLYAERAGRLDPRAARDADVEWEKRPFDPVVPPRSVADLVAWCRVEATHASAAWDRIRELDARQLFTIRPEPTAASSAISGPGPEEVAWTRS